MPARRTQERFEREISERFSNEIEVLGRYKNRDTKLLFRHKRCGHEWNSSPQNILHTSGCQKCYIPPRLKPHETFEQEVFARFNGEIELLERYVNKRTSISFRHQACGYEWRTNPQVILRADGCPRCIGKGQRTEEQFKAEVYAKLGDEFSVVGKFELMTKQVLMRHNSCGYEWMAWPSDFLNKKYRYHCWKCANAPRTTEQFIEQLYQLAGEEFTLLGEYHGAFKKIRLRHNPCGYEFERTAANFVQHQTCVRCAGKKFLQEDYEQRIYDLTAGQYSVVSRYVNDRTHVKMKHNTCRREWDIRPREFRNGGRCPHCNESKGERRIDDYLHSHSIQFKREHSFPDCRHINPLRFDFAIFDRDQLFCLIEYDGKQHFNGWDDYRGKTIRRSGDPLEKLQKRDAIKNAYCKKKGIRLIRIPYTEFDSIETILENELSALLRNEKDQLAL